MAKHIRHDDYCAAARFWSAPCTCGAATDAIVHDVTEAFRKDLAKIKAAHKKKRQALTGEPG